jgi:aspartyl-tRNA(Asn)/glutamyl-tRNA(Gln) amidotransferase subunit A
VRSREGVSPDVIAVFEAALTELEAAGAWLVDVVTPDWELCALTAMVGWQTDALDYHLETLQTEWSRFGRGIRRQFTEGMLLSPTDVIAADRVRRLLIAEADAILQTVDIVVTPTVGRTAVPWELRSGNSVDAVAFTSLWNITGGPATSVPMGFAADRLPLGIQFAGRAFDDARLLRLAHEYQRRTAHHLAVPAAFAPEEVTA